MERASAAINSANQALLMIQDDATVRAVVPDILAAARAHLCSRDTRLMAFDEWGKRQRRNDKPSTLSIEDREVLRMTRQAADSAADQANMNLRGFRNVLVVSLLLLTLLVVGVGLAAAVRPELFSLCGPAEGSAAGLPASDQGGRCPSGEDVPSGNDAVHVMILGAFGGALAAVFTLSRMKGVSGPYSLPSFQALLKLPAGSATALLGMLLLQNNMVTGFSPQRSGIVSAYAVIFGYGQQVVTRLVDRQAGNVQGPARSRNDPAKPPVVEPGTTTVNQTDE